MADNVNTRAIVLDMLIEIMENDAYSHLVLRDVLDKYQYLDKRDRSFMTRLLEGTIERAIELDYIIDLFSKVKTKKQKPVIRNILRMGVYQIKYMDNVPDSAVCNEAVKLAKKRGFYKLSGFVNGVLRSVVRGIDEISYPDQKKSFSQYLSVRYSMPEWIVNCLIDDYGTDKASKILEGYYQDDKATMIRCNLMHNSVDQLIDKLKKENVTVRRVDNSSGTLKAPEYALLISDYDYLNALKTFRDGDFYVQDLSSMMVAASADVKEGNYVMDLCAAPGGKSTHIAELMGGSGQVISRDLTENKVMMIEDNISRHKLDNIKAEVFDATILDEDSIEKADIVICDLPCSGLGVIGKKTDIKYKMDSDKIKSLASLQREILENASRYVKKGGTLIYSTCTINKTENDGNTSWFKENFKDYSLLSSNQMYPGEFGQDGFYIAKFVRGE